MIRLSCIRSICLTLFYQFKAFTSADSDILVLLEGLVGGSNDFKLEGLHVGRGEFKR